MGNAPDRGGFVLIVSVILLVSIAAIAAAFVSLTAVRARATASAVDSAKAFWLAEGGIQACVARLTADPAYRAAPTAITASLGGGTYTVSAAKRTGQDIYDITSRGTVGSIARTVARTAEVSMAGWESQFADYGVFAAGSISMQNTAAISGDAYAMGSVTTLNKAAVTGTVYAPGGSGNYVRLPLPSPPLGLPALDTATYTAAINAARMQPAGNRKFATLTLTGNTVYVNGNADVSNIAGAGTLVTSGTVNIGSGSISQNVTIISGGTISFSQNTRVGSGAILYSATGVSVNANNVVLENATVISEGAVTVQAALAANGIIFSKGDITFGKNAVIAGAVVSGGTVWLSQSDRIAHSAAQLPAQVPTGFGTAPQVTLTAWRET